MTTPNSPMPADPDGETQPPARDPLDQPLRDLLDQWFSPPAELIGQLPGRGGSPPLDFLNHAFVTKALIECDPCWSWEPMSYDADGLPFMLEDKNGNPQAMWIWLTVRGVRRPGFGACDRPGTPDSIKAIISDAITNAGMRFGIALSLWTGKHGQESDKGDKPRKPAKARKTAVSASEAPSEPTEGGRAAYDRLVNEFGKENVDGALATFNIAKFSEITPQKEGILRASLNSRAQVVEAQKMINDAFPDE